MLHTGHQKQDLKVKTWPSPGKTLFLKKKKKDDTIACSTSFQGARISSSWSLVTQKAPRCKHVPRVSFNKGSVVVHVQQPVAEHCSVTTGSPSLSRSCHKEWLCQHRLECHQTGRSAIILLFSPLPAGNTCDLYLSQFLLPLGIWWYFDTGYDTMTAGSFCRN